MSYIRDCLLLICIANLGQQKNNQLRLNDSDVPVLVTEPGWKTPCESEEELVVRNTYLNANQLFIEGDPSHTVVEASRDVPCACCRKTKPKTLNFAPGAALYNRPAGAEYRSGPSTPTASGGIPVSILTPTGAQARERAEREKAERERAAHAARSRPGAAFRSPRVSPRPASPTSAAGIT
jgi:hypothetical protein